MIIGFSFKNFMSFYDESVFSMRANADKKLSELNTIKTESGELLKSAFIFGANGSGKSNFIKAINYMKRAVLADFNIQSRIFSETNNFWYLKNAYEEPSAFEVEFIEEGTIYRYGFELFKGEVTKEYLYKKTKREVAIFKRESPDFKDISLSKDMAGAKELTKYTRRDTLFLYWANGGNNQTAMQVYRWFKKLQVFDATDTGQLLRSTVEYLKESEGNKESVLNLLQRADTNILDFELELEFEGASKQDASTKTASKKIFADPPHKNLVTLTLFRNYYNENWEIKGYCSTPVDFESNGTRNLFELSGPIVRAIENGSVLIIDEIDTCLHPTLVRFLVMMFNSISTNPKNAQLICNTHDLLLLDEDIRRDQIFFTEKNECGVSKLYALTDFKGVRKDSKLLKQYLMGAFGATPKLDQYFVTKNAK